LRNGETAEDENDDEDEKDWGKKENPAAAFTGRGS
jgi:hypothetical protein